MSRSPCPIDGHLDRPAIDASIEAGQSTAREIARRYQVRPAAVARHGRRCLAPAREAMGARVMGPTDPATRPGAVNEEE